MKTTTTKNRVEILKGDLIRFKINEREITWTIENFSNKNGLLISIKPEKYEVIRNFDFFGIKGNVINQ
jgi:hypothetical protein